MPVFAAEGPIRFNRDVRPIMSDTCFHCHGPDKNSRKGGLRLDIREEALKPGKSGAIPIVPGKPEESEIVTRIFTKDADDLMPPDDAHKELTAAQKEIFRRWVAEGAVYEAHWAYTPLVRPAVPKIEDARFTIHNPIDAFIAEKLIEKKAGPSSQADARMLARRLSLDITGLPPSPKQVGDFVKAAAGKSPSEVDAAYDALRESFFKSPHYGERMAVWWLDVARFTDTVGFHGDQNQRIFPYRDYVISAFNKNKPFDQFTRDQLAGDLLPNPTTEQLVASGFNRLNMMTREGGAQPKEYLAKYGAERVRTVGGAWMGATLGCSECHDHKFDPFTAKDFYAMQAFFADVKQWGVYSDYGYTKNPELKGWSNDYPFPPEIEVVSPYLKKRGEKLHAGMMAVAKKALAAVPQEQFAAWKSASQEFLAQHQKGWVTPAPQVTVSEAPVADKKKKDAPAKPAPKKDGAAAEKPKPELPQPVVEEGRKIVFSGKAADTTKVSLSVTGRVAAVWLELLPDARHGDSILRGGAKDTSFTVKPAISVQRKGADKAAAATIAYATATHEDPQYSSTVQQLNLRGGWKTSSKEWNQPQASAWILDTPVTLMEGDTLHVTIPGNMAGVMRVSVSPFAPLKPLGREWGAKLAEALKLEQLSDELAELYLTSTGTDRAAITEYRKLHSEWLACRDGKTWTMVTKAMDPLTVRILPRGNWMDETGEVTPPAVPEFLPATFRPEKDKPQATRLQLAEWLCSKENPLTPRATMNRLWKQFFGNGLSIVVDDLGAQGEPPSHPELLDWLACEFRDSGWDMQHMIRLMVSSSTYRQSSSLRADMREVDPANRLLSSQNPRRLDAEFVRDNALAISGALNRDLGGPSVKPYQPADYYENLQFPDRNYIADADDRQWRRGVYMHWQRTFLHPMLANFDAPMRDECTALRNNSNTPQQALTLLNDPTFVEAARVFAVRLLEAKSTDPAKPLDDAARLNRAFMLAVSRPAKKEERESLLGFLNAQREAFKANTADAELSLKVGLKPVPAELDKAEVAAWTSVCRVILNLHETITRY
ncbi:cytochrome c [Roseimicrobium gellanilyticum]|uniref:Cytochrome c n=2 Tax=Roseimicrobium gellanilyticum TaxID=748857 RepID=A0A366HQV3_9BACT|nr:cytochrome c [Roseimicrobium gellanilyticum]